MFERQVIEGQLVKKKGEIQGLEEKLRSAKVYVRALEDIIREIDKGGVLGTAPSIGGLRGGSAVAQVREVILERGLPIHIDELLTSLGRNVTRETKASLTSSLSAYVRKSEIFTRPAPNTFGLTELGHAKKVAVRSEPPENFGFGPAAKSADDEIPF